MILVCWLLASACQPFQPASRKIPYHYQDWKLADLRVLQNPPEQIPAELALVGLYTRSRDEEVQIRVDFLASRAERDSDVYLFLDTQPGGGRGRSPLEVEPRLQWDFVVILPAGGPGLIFRPDGSAIPALTPRYYRDSLISDLVVAMKQAQFPGNPGHFQVEAYATAPGDKRPAASIGPVWSDAAPPQAAPVLLAFWNTLLAATPAQTLRRWDGAHTGPLGQRHGLKELIEASAANNVPVALLDLKKPASLQALDYLNALPRIMDLEASSLLLLPDTAWGDPDILRGLETSRETAVRYGVKPSAFLYGSLLPVPPDEYQFVFARLQDPSHLQRSGSRTLIPLPTSDNSEFDLDHPETGLTIAVRRQIIAIALSPDRSDLFALGGSLPDSLWGDAITAVQALEFLGGHPWIQMLNDSGLAILLPAAGATALCPDWICLDLAENHLADLGLAALRRELEALPTGTFRDLAWDSYLRLTDPDPDPNRMALRLGYLPELQGMIRAAAWGEHPGLLSSCSISHSIDEKPFCFLANQTLFLAIDPETAAIRFAFGLIRNAPVQLIGPSSQMVVGLGDPSDWQPGTGILSDPQVIPGAFWDSSVSSGPFEIEAHRGEIIFSRGEPPLSKTFRLDGANLTVRYETQSSVETSLPLLVNEVEAGGQNRFGEYEFEPTSGGWRWGIAQGPHVEIRTDATGEFSSFLETRTLMRDPENPDREIPSGHYVPFPLAVINISADQGFTVTISVQ